MARTQAPRSHGTSSPRSTLPSRLCRPGILILIAAHLVLVGGYLALAVLHHDPLYLIPTVAYSVISALLLYKLPRTRARRRRATELTNPPIPHRPAN